jgi:LPS sulfotransferase NodH
MIYDPHEAGQRVDKFAKDEWQEDYFLILNQRLERVELPAIMPDMQVDQLPIIYIVGAPRSGTTLLSQLVIRHLPVGYINNLIARFWLRPSIGIHLSKVLFGDKAQQDVLLRSTHGTTEGAASPHEFGYFWRHWLKLDQFPTHHLSADMLSSIDKKGLKHALESEILMAFDCPVVLKNVICGFHAEFLTQLHPVSLFVHISRDLFATAASILKVRKERFGSYQNWWSLKPSTYPFSIASGDPVAEVVAQVRECQSEMEQELSKPGVHSIHITYEKMCAEPRQVINEIRAHLATMGCTIEASLDNYPHLAVASPSILPADLDERLREYLESRNYSNGEYS